MARSSSPPSFEYRPSTQWARALIPVPAVRSGGVSIASSGSYSTNRGRIPGFRTTSLRPCTTNVSPSWRVTRGSSALEAPIIARPCDRYDLGGPGDALGLALSNYGVDSDEEGHHGDGERGVAHRRESVQ